jgi:hypothetical protein
MPGASDRFTWSALAVRDYGNVPRFCARLCALGLPWCLGIDITPRARTVNTDSIFRTETLW